MAGTVPIRYRYDVFLRHSSVGKPVVRERGAPAYGRPTGVIQRVAYSSQQPNVRPVSEREIRCVLPKSTGT